MIAHRRDFKFTAPTRLDTLRHINDIGAIKVNAGDRESRFWLQWFLFNGERSAIGAKFDNAVTLGVSNGVRKNVAALEIRRVGKCALEIRPVKNVVTER